MTHPVRSLSLILDNGLAAISTNILESFARKVFSKTRALTIPTVKRARKI